MLYYFGIWICLIILYDQYFTPRQYRISALLPETIEKYGLSKTSKLNFIYWKRAENRIKSITILWLTNATIALIYAPIFFTLYYILEDISILKTISAIDVVYLIISDVIVSEIVEHYNNKLWKTNETYKKFRILSKAVIKNRKKNKNIDE